MTFTPAANIVVSYDAGAMIAFQEHGTIEVFQEAIAGNTRIKVFNNAPNSTFVSLKHSIGMSEGSKGTTLELEFVDPEGLFEDNLLSFAAEDMKAPRNNIIGEVIKAKLSLIENNEKRRNKLLAKVEKFNDTRDYRSKSKVAADLHAKATFLTTQNKNLEKQIEELRLKKEGETNFLGWQVDDQHRAKTEKELLQLQLDATYTELQRPVYITYGVGSNLIDWSPPQCFDKVQKVEYNFDGTGARSIKLIYTAVGIHPNLTQMGISPLGVLGMGTQTAGNSRALFNQQKRWDLQRQMLELKNLTSLPEEQLTDAPGLGDTVAQLLKKAGFEAGQTLGRERLLVGNSDIAQAIGAFWYPSIHMMIRDAMKAFIQNGTNYENVIVLNPNLDKLLGPYLYNCWDEVVDGMPWGAPGFFTGIWNWAAEIITVGAAGTALLSEQQEDLAGFAMTKEALEGLGMQLAESREFEDKTTQTGAIGENVWQAIEQCADPADAFKWLSTRKFVATVQCDNASMTFQQKLADVGKKIAQNIIEYNDQSSPYIPFLYVETDLNMLKLFAEAGLIKLENYSKPCIIWGDRDTIMNFLEARIMEKPMRKFDMEPKAEGVDPAILAQIKDAHGSREATKEQQFAHDVVVNLHISDILGGLTTTYMKKVLDYALPIAWIGPFGPTGVGDNNLFLEEDTNMTIGGGEEEMETLKKNQPEKANRMPVFSFGTKAPNVLSVDIDINQQYMDLINNAVPRNIPAAQMVNAIIPPKYKSMANEMFASIDDLNLADNMIDQNILTKTKVAVPRAFLPLVEPFFDNEWVSDDDVKMGVEWAEIFANLDPEEYSGLNDDWLGGKSFGGENPKEDFFAFMWTAFQDLMAQVHTPKSDQNVGGKNGSKSAQARMGQVAARMATHALIGSIKTLPFFNLASVRRAIRRTCLLYCIEPKFFIADKGGLEAGHTTWFSGIYDIVGFEHNISVGSVDSKFKIARSALRGGQIKSKK